MPTLTITRGFPGSGKSTWARKQLDKQTITINRDYLRMMTGGKWWPADEHMITGLQVAAIRAAIGRGLNVIVDDTFLKDAHVEQMRALADELGVHFTVNDNFLRTRLEECIQRDAARERSVGKDVIVRMYYEYWAQRPRPINAGSSSAILVDIDGTLARVPGRDEHTRGDFPYNREKILDECDTPLLHLLEAMEPLYEIILLSGRDSTDRGVTEAWLSKHYVPYDLLFMRDDGDNRPDTVVKKELYMRNVQGKWKVEFVIDDRPSVVRMWRAELGLKVLNVGYDLEF